MNVSFEVGDHVYLNVSPLCGTKRFHVRGKLAPRFVGPYPIIARVGELACKLQLPEELAGVHPVFNVSQLTRRSSAARDRRLQETLEYVEYPVKILDRAVKETRRTTIPYCKVLWSNHEEREATWEKEDKLKKLYPHLFETQVKH